MRPELFRLSRGMKQFGKDQLCTTDCLWHQRTTFSQGPESQFVDKTFSFVRKTQRYLRHGANVSIESNRCGTLALDRRLTELSFVRNLSRHTSPNACARPSYRRH